MLGSSRTGLAFHGKHAERVLAGLDQPAVAFNYGVPASGPVTHLVYLNRLLGDGVTPDVLVLEVMPTMLIDGPGAPLEKNWFHPDRLKFAEQDTVIRHGYPADDVRERWLKSVLVPAYALRFQIMSRLSPSSLPWQLRFDWSRGADECGWGTTVTQSVAPDALTKGSRSGAGRVRAAVGRLAARRAGGRGAGGTARRLPGAGHRGAAGADAGGVGVPRGSTGRGSMIGWWRS